MEHILYTPVETDRVAIVTPVPKENIERRLKRRLSDDEFKEMVYEVIPKDARKIRMVSKEDLPVDGEFRNAWVDHAGEGKIGISCEKAKEIKLGQMRAKREELLRETDTKYLRLLSQGLDTSSVVEEQRRLRAITEPLKSLDVTGKINDEELLNSIRELSKIS